MVTSNILVHSYVTTSCRYLWPSVGFLGPLSRGLDTIDQQKGFQAYIVPLHGVGVGVGLVLDRDATRPPGVCC